MYFIASDLTNSCPVMVINRNATALFLFVRLPPYIGARGGGGLLGAYEMCLVNFFIYFLIVNVRF